MGYRGVKRVSYSSRLRTFCLYAVPWMIMTVTIICGLETYAYQPMMWSRLRCILSTTSAVTVETGAKAF